MGDFKFQFPYGNYFCLDKIPPPPGRGLKDNSVSIPLRELFLFGP